MCLFFELLLELLFEVLQLLLSGISRVSLEVSRPNWNIQCLSGIYNHSSTTDQWFQTTIAATTWYTIDTQHAVGDWGLLKMSF